MNLPPLLFITNINNGDPQEDQFLSNYLSNFFVVTLVDITQAPAVLPLFKSCLIRNAWPSRLFVKEFELIKNISAQFGIKLYNPIHRNNFIEDKNYLVDLFDRGMPVIPTVNSLENLSKLNMPDLYIIKPIDGCSSFGVQELLPHEIIQKDLSDFIIQPKIIFEYEISFYYIDNIFVYATVSDGPDQRWELREYVPSPAEIEWANQFVVWNNLPYGLQRIDACRMKSGELLLMEVEDTFPVLSLEILSENTKNKVLATLVESLKNII